VLASKDPTIPPSACRFVHFLNRLGVEPGEVSDEHARAYLEAVALNEISRSPDVACRAGVNAWNLAVERIPGWPRRTLALPSRAKRIALPLSRFPMGFRDDLERYLERLAHPDPLDPEGDTRPMRPDTVRQVRLVIVRFASVLVHAGLEIEELDSLAPLVDPAHAERGLRWMLARNENRTSVGIAGTASVLRGIGRRHLRLEPERQAAIDRLARRLAVPTQKGMTAKNRERLRPLEDPETLRRLLLLPERLVARADAGGRTPYRAALDREVAAAVAILLACPVRLKNLAAIHLERSLDRPGDGRVFLTFRADEVKNARALEFELPAQVVSIVERHLATRSPLLCPHGTAWLFPKRDGGKPINRSQLGAAISRVIRRELGLEMNPHLFRHLAAMVWLNARPGAYEAARRLLGHAELSSTLNAYAGFEAGTATRLFAEILDAARRA
jgi:integrase